MCCEIACEELAVMLESREMFRVSESEQRTLTDAACERGVRDGGMVRGGSAVRRRLDNFSTKVGWAL